MTPLERFLEHVEFENCWNWTSALSDAGYGLFFLKGKTVLAHRVSYRNLVDRIPPKFEVHHLCENKRCVKPDHLIALSKRDHSRLERGWTVRENIWYCSRGHQARVTKKGACMDCKNLWNRKNRPSRAGV